MRWFMAWINAVVIVISLVVILALLIEKDFGTAWLWVTPVLYSYMNLIAIHEEDEK